MSAPPLTPLAAAALHVGVPERALVLQCGEGEAALFLAREFPQARVRGIDRSERAIRLAGARVGLDPEGRVAFKPGSPRAIPFPDDHFDLVTAIDTRPSPPELARVLRPHGHLILASSQTSGLSLSNRLLRWQLSRHHLEPTTSDRAGNGSYLIYCLTGRS
jgi:ubiquinone/menaquinone biosynthesis C-methylase UbiE